MKDISKKSLTALVTILFVGLIITPVIDAQSIIMEKQKKEDFIKIQEIFPKKHVDNIFYENPHHIEFAPSELIVKFRENTNLHFSKSSEGTILIGKESIDILNRAYSVKSIGNVLSVASSNSLSNIYKFVLPDDVDVVLAAKEYANDPNIEYCEPNYIYHTCSTPNDPYFYQQRALHQDNDCDIDALEAWNITTGISDVTIAIIDTGIDYTHPDLSANIWVNKDEVPDNNIDDDGNGFIDDIRGFDFANSFDENDDGDYDDSKDINDPDPKDDNGHGTHCAGIAGAVSNNGLGIAGVCWNCTIMPIKTAYDEGWGYSTDIVKSIVYAVDNGAKVISMSMAGDFSILQKEAIDYAHSKGVVIVAAAGNHDSGWMLFPAANENVIAVAATDGNDTKASFSKWGSWIDVAAPGVNILSTMPTYNVTLNKEGYKQNYDFMSGTSMACPYVAGVVALLLSKDPEFSPDIIESIVSNAVDEIDLSKYIGNGRINAHDALLCDGAVATLYNYQDLTIFSNRFKKIVDVGGTLNINGTASGINFQYYVVEYGKGKNPSSWSIITNSTSFVQNDVLASWDTSGVDDGLYTLRLRVVCINRIYKDIIWRVVNNHSNDVIVDDDSAVEGDYNSIIEAIDDSGSGDSVFVKNGTYYEDTLIIYKSINLNGENKNNTIIDGMDIGSVVDIFVSRVTLTGFTIQNFSTHIFWVEAGVYVYSNNNTIKDNHVKNIVDVGIFLTASSNSHIADNTIKNCNTGMWIRGKNNTIIGNVVTNNRKDGIYLDESFNNNISRNTMAANGNTGIMLEDSSKNIIQNNSIRLNKDEGVILAGAHNNVISYNKISDNGWHGIWLDYCHNNTISYNNITKNDADGLRIVERSNKNKILHNNFINNNFRNAFFRSSYFNRWDENYWDDWIGLKSALFKRTPKRIPGGLLPLPLIDLLHPNLPGIISAFDWHPAKEPYNI